MNKWVPPISDSQLPSNYDSVFLEKRLHKNKRLAKYLDLIGLENLSNLIENSKSIHKKQSFNIAKAWVEYVNRLVGVVIGILIVILLIFSLLLIRYRSSIYKIIFLIFIITIIQGWIGSLVVSTNLLPFVISIHMLLAFAIIALIIYAIVNSFLIDNSTGFTKKSYVFSLVTPVLSIIQVFFGSRIRERVDELRLLEYEVVSDILENMGTIFYFHRSFYWIILISNGYLIYEIYSNNKNSLKHLKYSIIVIICSILFMFISGTVMIYYGFPSYMQPLHLLISSILFGAQVYIFLFIRRHNQSYKIKSLST